MSGTWRDGPRRGVPRRLEEKRTPKGRSEEETEGGMKDLF